MRLYKRKNGKYWLIDFQVLGTRIRISSRTDDKQKAKAMMDKLRQEIIRKHYSLKDKSK